MAGKTDNRTVFDWVVWTAIHLVLVGGIGYAGISIYGMRLGSWVLASAFVAAMTSMYLFHVNITGETLMKCILGLCVAANAGYLIHNGAQAMGVEAYNAAQVQKFEAGMAAAAQAKYRSIAKLLGSQSAEATGLERAFSDGVSLIAGILAFLELSSAIVIFSIASKRFNRSSGMDEAAKIAPRATTTSISMAPQPAARTNQDPKA